jgi:hypothetical protein
MEKPSTRVAKGKADRRQIRTAAAKLRPN